MLRAPTDSWMDPGAEFERLEPLFFHAACRAARRIASRAQEKSLTHSKMIIPEWRDPGLSSSSLSSATMMSVHVRAHADIRHESSERSLPK